MSIAMSIPAAGRLSRTALIAATLPMSLVLITISVQGQIISPPGGIPPTGGGGGDAWYFAASEVESSYDASDGTGTATVELSILEDDDNDGYPQDTVGFSMSLAHDDEFVVVLDAVAVEDLADLNDGDGPDLLIVDLDPVDGPGVTVEVIYGVATDIVLDYEFRRTVIGVSYETVASEFIGGTSQVDIDISWDDLISDVSNVIDLGATSEDAGTADGLVSFVRLEPVFLRGDVDGNGTLSPLLDSLRLLTWAFSDGEAPTCMDAADVDGNNTISALIDSLALLQYGFAQGDDPPDPGPTTCGPDPEDDGDDLDCSESPPDCV